MNPLLLFVVQAVIIILCARVAGRVAGKLHQPMVIAELAAGIALGPSVLGWLSPGVEAALFPKASLGQLSIVSQVGLLLFMFLVGLKFDAAALRGRVHAAVAISHMSIAVPFALGGLFALRFYARLSDPSVSRSSFVLFMGVSMSITAFPVLARILSERRMLHTEIGTIAIACAAVDDITCWCILAFILALARATGVTSAIATVAMALGYTALIFGPARRVASSVADRITVMAPQRLVAVTVLLVFASSAITELIGIHAVFGAFLCGAMFPRTHEIPRQIAGKLEDLVEAVMLPLFFAFSGLRTEIGLLSHASDWWLCALVIVLACLGKFGGSVVAARVSGLGWRQSSAIGILMNTRGLVELVVLNIGYDLGLISPMLFTMLVIMALVTTFMTAPLLRWLCPLSPSLPRPA